jgi:hypothetical protein
VDPRRHRKRHGDPHAGPGILADPDERQAIIDNKAIVIALGRAEHSVWDKFRCLARHWDLIEDLLTEDGPAAAVLWLSRNQLEKL